jgi:hypothetical protein
MLLKPTFIDPSSDTVAVAGLNGHHQLQLELARQFALCGRSKTARLHDYLQRVGSKHASIDR